MKKEYRVTLKFSIHHNAIDASYVMRILRFRCTHSFEAIKYTYDYLHFSDADETTYPYEIFVEEVH